MTLNPYAASTADLTISGPRLQRAYHRLIRSPLAGLNAPSKNEWSREKVLECLKTLNTQSFSDEQRAKFDSLKKQVTKSQTATIDVDRLLWDFQLTHKEPRVLAALKEALQKSASACPQTEDWKQKLENERKIEGLIKDFLRKLARESILPTILQRKVRLDLPLPILNGENFTDSLPQKRLSLSGKIFTGVSAGISVLSLIQGLVAPLEIYTFNPFVISVSFAILAALYFFKGRTANGPEKVPQSLTDINSASLKKLFYTLKKNGVSIRYRHRIPGSVSIELF